MRIKTTNQPIRIITNPSYGLMNKIQKAGVTLAQLVNYINRSTPKRARGKNNNHKFENAKKEKKYKKLKEEFWKDVFKDDTATYVRYI